ncbi:hypothetical protein GA0115240_14581 [Streptomyces sp. DvalAA-14]|nr:hypothetical protein GA0115240_14581 [Streptomyces sp. DvalAA-14]
MHIPRLAWLTPRRLVTATVLAAVFAAGWFLGQPVPPAQCELPTTPKRYSNYLASEPFRGCGGRSRLLTWLSGDFR